jgi:hypothetical protein
MSMAVAWLLFPLLLVALCVGSGLLVERIAAIDLPGALLPSVGLATIVVIAVLTTFREDTAEFATAAVMIVAIAGYATSVDRVRRLRLDAWAVAAAAAVYVVSAAPVVLSGRPSFLGYFFLNDTAVHFALMDHLLVHGREVSGLAPGAFGGIVTGYINTGYPLGSQAALGAVRPLVAQDVAWIFQPYLAVLMALTAAALYQVLSRMVVERPFRALIAFVAAQPGLVYAYYLSASIKEIATIWIMVVTVGVVLAALGRPHGIRRVVPVIIVAAAGLGILNLAIAAWVALPLAVFLGVVLWQQRRTGRRERIATVAVLIVVGGVMAFPAIETASSFFAVAGSVLTTKTELGHLVRPIEWWQILGIWPRGDFRFQLAAHQQVAFALMGIAIGGFVLGALLLVRRYSVGPLILLVTALAAALFLTRLGSPYANAKTLTIASPAIVLTALLGAVALRSAGRRIEASLLAAVITGGVLWTNALAYHNANLAPRDRFAELSRIDNRFAGQGPSFYNQSDEFAVHFLRKTQPWNPPLVTPVRRPDLPPRNSGSDSLRFPYDTDELDPSYLQRFPLLVLGRSPLASRPPADYRLVYRGRYYEVWRRAAAEPRVIAHLPLGSSTSAAAVPSCATLRRLAARAVRDKARLAYVERVELPMFVPTAGRRPADWGLVEGEPLSVIPRFTSGSVAGPIEVPVPADYMVWIQGTFDRGLPVYVNGRRLGTAGPWQLGPPGQFISVGRLRLGPGRADIRIYRPGDNLSPGDGGTNRYLGPLVLQPPSDVRGVRYLEPRRVSQLCGKRLDWVEIVL